MTIFGVKMMMKSGLEFFHFEIELAPSELLLPNPKKIVLERLNWPGRFACIPEGARSISE